MNTSAVQLSFSIIEPEMTVKAMRDSGYKSTTHALAELIDNSIESHATAIEVFGIHRSDAHTPRPTLKELAVLDNGVGMDRETLRGSLRYGHGTRRERRGIGRFGLGLPNSSMSQARRVDVWSWQSGATNALHTHLSLDDVEQGLQEIPEPERQTIPKVFRESSRNIFGDTGTLVVWSDLDRVEWRRTSTIFKHTEELIGRIYRRFLVNQTECLHPDDPRLPEIGLRRTITLIPVYENGVDVEVQENEIVEVRPNDPLYLMTGTSCPESFGVGPMFTEIPGSPFPVPVKYQGTEYKVWVRASYARPHVRNSDDSNAEWPKKYAGNDAGHTPWGKHANRNMGVSLIRAHREVQLDVSWVNGNNPTERWWTVEIDFPTGLDDVFGVTNNKQGTMTFQRLKGFQWERDALPGEESLGDVRRRMEEEGDYRSYLLDLRKQIDSSITFMRQRVKQSSQSRGQRHIIAEDQKADAKVTAKIKRRIEEGHEGKSDKDGRSVSDDERRLAEVESLTKIHKFDRTDALKEIDETIQADSRVRWIQSSLPSIAFFDVESLPNLIQVALNTNHPVHSHLYDIMHPDVEKMTEDEVRERLARTAAAFRVLIYSWARYEDEQAGKARRQVITARTEWGKYAEDFFDEDDDSVSPTDLV